MNVYIYNLFTSVVYNLKTDKYYVIGGYNSISKRHKLEKGKLRKMIDSPTNQFKNFLEL